jgi:hypothetical protein
VDQPTFSEDVPNPHALGQQAAQDAGAKPVAAAAQPQMPPMQMNRNANFGIPAAAAAPATPATPAAPAGPASDEPSFDEPNTLPYGAESAMRQQMGGGAPGDVLKAAQQQAVKAKVDAVTKALGGAAFNPATGDSSVIDRARMGVMSTAADREAYLKNHMPAGTDVKAINVQGQPMVVFKPPGSDVYQPVKGTEDIEGRIGDTLAAVPAVAAQVGTAYATGGESLIARLIAQAVGGAGERGLELATNNAGGYDKQSLRADAYDMAKSGAADTAGELTANIGANALGKGGGIMAPSGLAEERLAASKSLQAYDPNLRGLTGFQLGHPLLEAKGARLAAVNPTLGNIAREQSSTLADVFRKSMADATGGSAPALGDAAVTQNGVQYPGLEGILSKMQEDVRAPLAAIPETSPVVGGQAFQQGVNDLKTRLAGRTADKFSAAFDTANSAPAAPNGVVPFDLSGPQAAAAKEATPVVGQGVPKTTATPIMADAGGAPIQTGTKTEVTPTEVKIGGISPSIKKIVDDLQALNPQQGVGPMTDRTDPYGALKALRSGLSEASVYNPMASAAERQASGQAQRILRPLDESLVTPGEGAPAEFVPQMKAAQNAAKFQGKVLDNPDMQAAMHTPYPEDVMKLANPDNITFLKIAQRTMDPASYGKFQDAFATSLIRNPEKISALMQAAQADPSVLDRLLKPGSKDLLKQYGIDMGNVGKSLPASLMKQPDYSARARQAFDGASGADLQKMVQYAGGQDSPVGQNLRGALFQNVLDGSMDEAGKLDMKKAISAITNVMKDGKAASVLTQEELKRLNDLRTFAQGGAALSGDMGSGIYKSEMAGKTMNPIAAVMRPGKYLLALGELAEARVQSHYWTGNKMIGTLFGQPGGTTPAAVRAATTGGAAYLNTKAGQEKQQ